MKAAVITRHAITNYGSLLQAIATEKLFETVGLECETIDYIRDDEYYTEQEKTNLKNKPKYNSNPLTRAAYLALRQGEAVKGGRFFRDMQKKYLHLTKRYHSRQIFTLREATRSGERLLTLTLTRHIFSPLPMTATDGFPTLQA